MHQLPEIPLAKWRKKFEDNSLTPACLTKYFLVSSPYFFDVENSSDVSDLGK